MNYKRVLSALIPSIIFLALLTYLIGVNLTFILNPELEIRTIIPQNSFNVLNGDSLILEFESFIDSPKTCSTVCLFVLKDVSSNEILYLENKTLSVSHKSSIPITIENSFSGVVPIQYKVSCYNPVSPICSSTQETYFENTFITITHNQTSSQIAKQNNMQLQLETISLHLAQTSILLNESNHILSQLNFSSSEEQDLELDLFIVSSNKDYLETNFSEFVSLWDAGLYESINVLDIVKLVDEVAISQSEAESLKETTLSLVDFYNQYGVQLNHLVSNKELFKFLSQWYELKNETLFKNELSSQIVQLEHMLTLFREKNISSIISANNNLASLTADLNYSLYVYDRIEFQAKKDISQKISYFTSENASSFSSACSLLEYSLSSIISRDLIANTTLQNNYSALLSNTTFLDLLDTYALSTYLNISFINDSYPFSAITPFHLNWTNDLLKLEKTYCFELEDVFNLQQIHLANISLLNISLENKSIELPVIDCCIYGNCSSCLSNSYPIIMIHGHAFNRDTSVQASLHSFSKVQNNLENYGYFNVGELSDYVFAEWSHLPAPISVRATYYYLSYVDVGLYQLSTKKTESIENYAIRLKELIDEVKVKTDSDKVIILAHSMGGLVAREYLLLFGEDSVDTIIFVGTPNGGIIGSTEKLCSLLGAKKECEEMTKNSLFLKKLSLFVPSSTKMFTIAGVGCDMGDYVGDGVVTVENVALPYATNFVINGTCTDSLQTDLHSNLLDPTLYPEVQTIITNIILVDT